MKRFVSSALVAVGMLIWLIGGNLLVRRHRIHGRRIFGHRWPVLVKWSALSDGEWLQLLALAIASLTMMALGFWLLD